MSESFDAIEYLEYLRRRWVFACVSIGVAIAVALGGGLLLPKQYTAVATLVIEPPGADPRTATAVSSIYLESLKSYEAFASSDSLFAKAADEFHLLDGKTRLEAFKRRVLRVEKLKDTKVLQISVTLPDAGQAHALASYLAEATVGLARDLAHAEGQDLLDSARQQLDEAAKELEKARAEASSAAGPESALTRDLQSLQDRLGRALDARTETSTILAESTARGDQQSAAANRAGVEALTTEINAMQKQVESKSAGMAAIEARRQSADDRLRSAQDAMERASRRRDDLTTAAAFRTEQMRIVDPGVVPQTPSFPNLPLAVIGAGVLSGMLCLMWLTLQFGLSRRREQPPRAGLRVAGGGGR